MNPSAVPSDIPHQGDHLFFTWSAQRKLRPWTLVGAEGCRFETAEHGWLWDLESQVYNVNVGHRRGHVIERMKTQLDAIPAAAPNAMLPIRAELGAALSRVTGMAKSFLTTGGSEAVENAIKIARLVTGRDRILCRRRSYHGATLAVLGVSGDNRRDPFAASLPEPWLMDDPYPPRAPNEGRPSDWVENLEALLERAEPERVAAIMLEGYTGTNGMQVPPEDFWPRVRALCDRHGILLIDDEIFSGFGRTGRFFAIDRWGVRPDMITMGKGLTSGYAPLAGVACSAEIAARFEDEKLWCGLTTYAHPVSCAAALGSIELIEGEDLCARAEAAGQIIHERLAALASPHIVDLRGFGLMRCVQLDQPVAPLLSRLLERGVFAPGRDDMLFVCPPLCMKDEEARTVADLLAEAIGEL